MSGEVIKEFLVSLGYEVDDKAYKAMTDGIDRATKQVAKFGAVVVGAATAVSAAVTQIALSYKDLAVSSQLLNTSAKNMEMLSYAARSLGSNTQDADSSLENLSHTINNTLMRVGNGAYMFHALGVNIKDANGHLRDTTDVLFSIGDAIKGFSQSKQLVILENLGISPTMLKTITSNTTDLRHEFDALYKSVGLDSNKAAAQGLLFNTSLQKLGFTLEAIYKGIGVRFIPALGNAIDTFRKALTIAIPSIIDGLTPILNTLLGIGGAMLQLGVRGFEVFAELNRETNGWAGYILAAAAAWRVLNLSFLASPVGIILSLGAAILALTDDYKVWKDTGGKGSLIDWAKWEPGIREATRALAELGRVEADVVGGTGRLLVALGALAAWDFKTAAKMIKGGLGNFGDAVLSYGDYASNIGGPTAYAGGGRAPAPRPVSSTFPAASGLGGSVGPGFLPDLNLPAGMLQPPMSSGVTVHQKTDIHVNGNGDPMSTGRNVALQQANVSAETARNFKGAAR